MSNEAKQALFIGDDSSRGLEQLVAGEDAEGESRQISVKASDGTIGAATLLLRSGAFSYTPYETPARSTGCNSCCKGRKSAIKVSAADLLGATHEGTDGFCIWYCPIRKTSANKLIRQLCKSSVFRCQSVSEARAMVAAVRTRTASAHNGEQPRHAHIVLNPVSGPGKAKRLYDLRVQRALEAAGIQHTLHVTRHAGHAAEVASSLDLGQCDLLLLMGGDGTVHEALQGWLSRPDWQKVAAIPMALLPAGSGNALAANTGMWNLATALHAVVKGHTAKLDIFSVLQPPHKRRFAFLSVTFGLMANLDIGTEHLRFLGGARFTLGALHQILAQRTHRLRLAYLPVRSRSAEETVSSAGNSSNADTDSAPEGPDTSLISSIHMDPRSRPEDNLPKGWIQLGEENTQLFAACNLPLMDMTYNLAPRAGLETGCLDIISTIGKFGRLQGLDLMLKSESGRHLDLPGVRVIKAEALLVEPVSTDTWLVVDGEVVPFARLVLQVHPGLCTVMVAPGHTN